MENLVMKIAHYQMSSFNLFIDHFFNKINPTNNSNVIGLDSLADSIYQMALGKQAQLNGIKTKSTLQSQMFSTVNSNSSNILLNTWIDLVIFSQ